MNNTAGDDSRIGRSASFTNGSDGFPSLESRTAVILWQVLSPCLLLFGGFGNIATIIVMRRIKDSNSSQHAILMALAMSDFCILCVSLLREWLYFMFYVDVYELHIVVCKLSWWLIYGNCSTSSWLLTFVTVQRTLAVKWPHKIRMMCSMRRTWTVIAAIVFTAGAMHFHFVLGMGISRDNKCTYSSEAYKDLVTGMWTWVDLTVFSLLPYICLLVCDVVLSLTLFKATSTMSVSIHAISYVNSARNNNRRRKTASKTVVMILALSCTFLLLTMPVSVNLVLDHYGNTQVTKNYRLWTRKTIAFAVTMFLWYTNSAVNFLLYCFTGNKFRKEFLKWFCCGTHDQSTESVTKTASRASTGRKQKLHK